MLFRSITTVLIIVLIYISANIATTAWVRLMNPLHKLPKKDTTIYLTFDDGVDANSTPILLGLLKEYHIKATFFVVAETLKQNSAIIEQMKNDGHIIGLHSWSHKNLILQNPLEINHDFRKSMDAFYEHNMTPIYYRPPWGHVSILGLCNCKFYGLKLTLWNVIVQDWVGETTPQIICNKLTQKVNGNAVICLHDGRGKNNAPQKTIAALSEMIPKWIEEGYHFETIDKLYK